MSTEITTDSRSLASADASACATVSTWCACSYLQRGQVSAYAPPACPQRADPRKAILRLADRAGPHSSWGLKPDQEPVLQEGLPWELP